MPRPPSGPPVQVVWFKKDLRVRDHAPLARAAERGPVLPLYLYEPEQVHHEEFAGHHLTYLNDCLAELDGRLRAPGTPLVVRRGEAVAVLEELSELVPIGGLWAHEETGNGVSYTRDRRVRAWARERGIPFTGLPQNGVVRRLRDRDGWADTWEERVAAPLVLPPCGLWGTDLPPGGLCTHAELGVPANDKTIPPGGEACAHATLESFLTVRGVDYMRELSSPLTAEESCSRLSAPLALGILSLREVGGRAGDPPAPRVGQGRFRRPPALGPVPALLREPPALALPLHPAAGVRAADGVSQP